MSDAARSAPVPEAAVAAPVVSDGGAAAAPPVNASPPVAPSPAEPLLIEPVAPAASEPAAASSPDDDLIAAARAPGIMSVPEPESKPAEAPKPAEPATTAPTEAKEPSAEAPAALEPLSYAEHKLTLPEGVTFEDARLGEYDAILGGHRLPAEARQQLADLYAGDVQRMAQDVRREQWKQWNDTLEEWSEGCATDREFGGSRFETSQKSAVRMIEFAFPTEQERREWNEAALATGWGRHPVMFRFLNRMAQRFAEPARSPPNIQPAPPQTAQVPRNLRSFYSNSRAARGR